MKKIFIKDWVSISNQGFFSKRKKGLAKNFRLNLSKNKIHNLNIASLPDELELELKSFIKDVKPNKNIDRTVKFSLFLASKFSEKLKNCGISIGSSRASTSLFESAFKNFIETNKVSPLTSPLTTHGFVSSYLAKYLNSSLGINLEHSVTCSSGIYSLLDAIVWLESGRVNNFITGGVEAPLTEFTLAQMKALKIYTNKSCYPFNGEENTFLLGEGGAFFSITNQEETEIEIASFGTALETDQSLTGLSDNGNNFYNAMNKATNNKPDVILAHAPGTLKGDLAELNAIERLYPKDTPYIFSTKSVFGHTFGASGSLSLAFACELLSGLDLPEINYKNIIKSQKKPKKVESVLVNTAGFGGNAMSVLVKLNS